MRHRSSLALAALGAACGSVAGAAPLPTGILTCSATSITEILPRLEGSPDSGVGVVYANGGHQVSYAALPEIRKNARIGDHVFMCLVFIPKHCPKGDARGRIYTTTDLRTLESWTLPDSQHSCGGA